MIEAIFADCRLQVRGFTESCRRAFWANRCARNYLIFSGLVYFSIYFVLYFFPYHYGVVGEHYTHPLTLSPRIFSIAADLKTYVWFTGILFDDPIGEFNRRLLDWFKGEIPVDLQYPFLPGPAFIAALKIFDYGPNNPAPFILFCFLVAWACQNIWLHWFRERGLRWTWGYIFILFPVFPFMALLGSTNVMFAGLFAGVFLCTVRYIETGRGLALLITLGAAAALTRPTGLQAIALVQIALILRHGLRERVLIQIIHAAFAICIILYYVPYFMYYYSSATSYRPILGLPESYILSNWPDTLASIPVYLRESIYVLCLKAIYIVGLDPPPSGYWLPWLVRLPMGLIFLLGLFTVWKRGHLIEKLSVAIMLVPLLIGHVKWNYIIQIMPILFLHGAFSLEWIWLKIRRLSPA